MRQYRAILYKEWVKSRRVLLAATGIGLCTLFYSLFSIYRTVTTFGMVQVYHAMIDEGLTFLAPLRYLPLLIGVALGIAQMVPEALQHRLKLTLHFPLHDSHICYSMLSLGLFTLLVFNALVLLTCGGLLIYYLPYELVARSLLTYLPWGLAGFTAYLLTAWVCLEHHYYARALAGLLSLALLDLYFYSGGPNSLCPCMFLLLLGIAFLSLLLPRYAIARCRTGYIY